MVARWFVRNLNCLRGEGSSSGPGAVATEVKKRVLPHAKSPSFFGTLAS
jgi:hypothetical protein